MRDGETNNTDEGESTSDGGDLGESALLGGSLGTRRSDAVKRHLVVVERREIPRDRHFRAR